MAINLKEIFSSDSDQIKLDKVNYNFDQIEANGGGPQGPAGQNGATGVQGTMGPQGAQGPQGSQGSQGDGGSEGGEYWTQIDGDPQGLSSDTLVPTHNPAEVAEAPNIVIGYKSDDAEYNQPEGDAKLVVHRHNNYESNIRLKTQGVPNDFDFILSNNGTNTTILTGKFTGGTPNLLSHHADRIKLLSNDGLTEYVNFDGTTVDINVDANLQNTVVNGTLRIASGNPDTDKIAVAGDLAGTIQFKDINELGGTVPVGTIISILPSIFSDNTKFLNQETVTLADNDNDLLPIRVGSGVGDYEGWYICNGKTWKDGSGFTFATPDLNSFSYDIEDNADSTSLNGQGQATVTNNGVQVIGGSDIDLNADYTGSSTYDITSTIDASAVDIQDGTGTLNVKIKKLPQIIYIGEADLYWEDAGSGQAPPVTAEFEFDNQGTSQQSFFESHSGGTSQTITLQLQAPSLQKWTSAPAITAPAGFPGTILSRTINSSDDTLLDVVIGYTHPTTATTYSFTYSSSGSTAPNEATYTLSVDNGVTINSSPTSPITVSGNNGNSTAICSVTFNAPSGYEFTSANDITAPSGYTIVNPNLVSSTQITAGLSVDSFDSGSFNVAFTSTLSVDMSAAVVNNVIISTNNYNSGNNTVELDIQWFATGFNSSTMEYRVSGVTTNNTSTPSFWDQTVFTSSSPENGMVVTASVGNDFAHARVEIVEQGNPTNIGPVNSNNYNYVNYSQI